MFCGGIPLSSGVCGTDCIFEYNHNERSLTISGSEIQNYKTLKQIPWYPQMKRIQNITFIGIKRIGNNSFNGAMKLFEIRIPSNIISIGKDAFSNCKNLKIIRYEGMTNPCVENAFNNIHSSVVFVSLNYKEEDFCGLKPSDSKCGEKCEWIYDDKSREIKISGLGEMYDYSVENVPWFEIINSVKTITISGISSIGSNAFKNFVNLEKITIGSTVKSIGFNPFIGCTKLSEVIFESDEYFKFEHGMIITKNNTELISYLPINTETEFIFLPDDLEIIRPYSFYGNSFLQTIVIPLNVTTICNKAFSQCVELKNIIYLGCFQPSIENDIFEGTKVNSIKIKNECSQIKFNDITMNSLTSTQSGDINYLFDVETGLMVFYNQGEMETYVSYDKYSWYSKGNSIKHIIFEKGVESVGKYAFYNYYNNYPQLKNVKIGNTITNIGQQAFQSCSSIKTVSIGNKVTSIGANSFNGCSGMSILFIGNSLSSINLSSFSGCTSLITLTLPKSLKTININAFSDCTSLETVIFKSSSLIFGDNVFSKCTSLKTIYYYGTTNPEIVGTPPFNGCTSLTTVYVPINYTDSTNSFCGTTVTVEKTLTI